MCGSFVHDRKKAVAVFVLLYLIFLVRWTTHNDNGANRRRGKKESCVGISKLEPAGTMAYT